MSLYPDGLCLVVDLGIGAILASFHVLGNWPLEIDKLKRFVSEGATTVSCGLEHAYRNPIRTISCGYVQTINQMYELFRHAY